MTLKRLRQHVLLVLGVPACMSSSSSTKPVADEPKWIDVKDPHPNRVVDPRFDPATCAVDTIAESFCNPMRGNLCADEDVPRYFGGTVVVSRESDVREQLDTFLRTTDPARCCYARCTLLVEPDLPKREWFGQTRDVETCIPAPPKGTTRPAYSSKVCPKTVSLHGQYNTFRSEQNGQCCYVYAQPFDAQKKRGRPARVDGVPRFAMLERLPPGGRDAWHAALAISEPHDAESASEWLEAAQLEHASIAAFATTALHLLRFGAPPELVAAAHRAALDEIEHARLSFALAAKFGAAVSPAAFDVRVTELSFRDFAIETFVDGCIGETAAAFEAQRSADAGGPLAPVYARIAADEMRHAELAWSIVAWCCERDATILDELAALL